MRRALPAPGATNVPTNVGTLILTVLDPWPASGIHVKDAASGASVSISPTSVPSPLPTGLDANSPYEAVAVPTLAPSTTYNVSQRANTTQACSADYILGSFTTS